MPELPEVETIARGVNERIRCDRIAEAWFSSYKEPFKTPPAVQLEGLEGRSVLSVHRTGKHIVCELGLQGCKDGNKPHSEHPIHPDAQWIVHLGMTGRLLVTESDAPVVDHTHARLHLESRRELRFVDPRRFGRLEFRLLDNDSGFRGAGLEPLAVGAEEFARLFRGRKIAIKPALLNQSLLTGIGNIYADEGLFRAGIRPRKAAGRLTRVELERLRLALREVLEHAISLGGSSVSDYVDANGVRGFFQLEHYVYQRGGEPCRRCGTPIKRIVLGGRSTHFCPHCQK